MDWQQLRYFLAVAESGSLAGAARRLGVSKATAWRQVRALETFLGAALLERGPGGYALTPAGRRFLAGIEGANRQIENACRALAADASPVEGEVRVLAPELLGDVVAAGLPALHARHPGLSLELVTGSPAAGLVARDADIALRFEQPRGGGFVRAAAYPIRFAIYASAAYLKRFGAPKRLDDFAGHKLIDFEHSLAQLAPEPWRRQGGRGAEVVFRSNSPYVRRAAARAGLGLALLAETFMRKEGPSMRAVFDGETVGALDLLVLVATPVRHEPRVVAARDYFCDSLADATRPAKRAAE